MNVNAVFGVGFVGGMFFSIGALFLMINGRRERAIGLFCLVMSTLAVVIWSQL